MHATNEFLRGILDTVRGNPQLAQVDVLNSLTRKTVHLASGQHIRILRQGRPVWVPYENKSGEVLECLILDGQIQYIKTNALKGGDSLSVISEVHCDEQRKPVFRLATIVNDDLEITRDCDHPYIAGKSFNDDSGLNVFTPERGNTGIAFGISLAPFLSQVLPDYQAQLQQLGIPPGFTNPDFPRINQFKNWVASIAGANEGIQFDMDQENQDGMDVEDAQDSEAGEDHEDMNHDALVPLENLLSASHARQESAEWQKGFKDDYFATVKSNQETSPDIVNPIADKTNYLLRWEPVD